MSSWRMNAEDALSEWLPGVFDQTVAQHNPHTGVSIRRTLIAEGPRGAKRAPWPRPGYYDGSVQPAQSFATSRGKLGQSASLPNLVHSNVLMDSSGFHQNLSIFMTNGTSLQHSPSAASRSNPKRTVPWPRPGASATNWRVGLKNSDSLSPRDSEGHLSDEDTWEDCSARGQENDCNRSALTSQSFMSPRREVEGWEGQGAPAHWRRTLLRPMKLKALRRAAGPTLRSGVVEVTTGTSHTGLCQTLVSAPVAFSQTAVSWKSQRISHS